MQLKKVIQKYRSLKYRIDPRLEGPDNEDRLLCPRLLCPRCPEVRLPRCPEAKLPKCPDVKLLRCPVWG